MNLSAIFPCLAFMKIDKNMFFIPFVPWFILSPVMENIKRLWYDSEESTDRRGNEENAPTGATKRKASMSVTKRKASAGVATKERTDRCEDRKGDTDERIEDDKTGEILDPV